MPASDKNFPGRPLNRSARVWNRIIDHVDGEEKKPRERELLDNGLDVQIRNDTGEDLPLGSAVAIDADGYILDWAEQHYYDFWFAGTMPATDSATFAITLAAIKQDEIGPARVSGRAMVRLHLTDITHRRGKLTPGATYLSSANSLPGEGAKIIALQATLGVPDQVVPAILNPPQQGIRIGRTAEDIAMGGNGTVREWLPNDYGAEIDSELDVTCRSLLGPVEANTWVYFTQIGDTLYILGKACEPEDSYYDGEG